MSRKVTIILITFVLLFSVLFGTDSEDFKFIYGLFSDSNYSIAKSEINRFENNYPDSEYYPVVRLIFGDILFAEKNYSEADKVYKSIYEKAPVEQLRGEAVVKQIQCLYHLNKYGELKKLRDYFVKTFPNRDDRWMAYYWNAKAFLNENKISDAYSEILLAEKIISNADIQSAKVQIMIPRGQDDETSEEVEEMLSKYPKHPGTDYAYVKWFDYNYQNKNFKPILERHYRLRNDSRYYNDYLLILAQSYYELEDYTTALDVLQRMDKYIDKKSFYQGLSYERLGRVEEAKNKLRRLYENSDDPEVKYNSFFKLVDIISLESPDKALAELNRFIADPKNKNNLDSAYYQKAQIQYLLEQYPDAINSLVKLSQSSLNTNLQEKAQFLYGDIYYMLERYTDAIDFYEDYVTIYESGLFLSEVYFKLGMSNLALRNWQDSKEWFEKVINEFPEDSKATTSIYYIGELYFLQHKYKQAVTQFTKALDKGFETNVTNERIAHAYYYSGQYDKAMTTIEKIPEMEPYLFDKYMLEGNIEFNRDKNNFALIYYQIAKKYVKSKEETELVLSQTAWTYYKMERYDEAKDTFRMLSEESDTPDKYLLLSANAAFNHEDYQQAINVYEELIKKYKKSKLIVEATLGIANAYYNLGDYQNSFSTFTELLTEHNLKKNTQLVIDGLYWNMIRDNANDYRDDIKTIINKNSDDDENNRLLAIQLKWEMDRKLYNDAVKTGKELIENKKYYGDNDELVIQYAEALKNIKDFNRAENLFTKTLKKLEPSKTNFHLADIYLAKGDTTLAITSLRSIQKEKPEYSSAIRLLRISRISNNPDFITDYTNVVASGVSTDYAEAKLQYVEYYIDKNKVSTITNELEQLLKHDKKQIRASAQYLKGKSLYIQKKYSDAIPELLRVKYIYPEFKDIVLNAEYYTTLSYIKSGRNEEATKLLKVIKSDLPIDKVKSIERMLK